MKIGFYNPYFDAFGGGERYVLTIASHWSDKHLVSVFWDDPEMLGIAQKRFSLDLARVKSVPNVFAGNLLRKMVVTVGYDMIFVLSDGSVPLTAARHNILHFQVPFANVRLSLLRQVLYKTIVCNSNFTRDHLDIKFRDQAVVIYPPVDIHVFRPVEKTKTIVSVGRFSAYRQAKKQEVMIDAFRVGVRGGLKGWNLVLAGSRHPQDNAYFESLIRKAKGLPVEFYPDCDLEKLKDIYGKAGIYWHAAGYGESDPTVMEHFGISTVEAMSAGCVPVVYDGGGQPEIIVDGNNGYLWKTPDSLLEITSKLVSNRTLMERIRKNAIRRSIDFSVDKFTDTFDRILESL